MQFLLAPQSTQISYAQFKKYLYEGKIAQVLVSDTLIRGTLKPQGVDKETSKTFTVVPVDDPNLVQELETRHVDCRGQYESPFVKTLLAWILPAIIVIAIWIFAMRRLGAWWRGDGIWQESGAYLGRERNRCDLC